MFVALAFGLKRFISRDRKKKKEGKEKGVVKTKNSIKRYSIK